MFVIDVQDRKVLAWHAAAGTGISGSMERDLKAVELPFGGVRARHAVEWPSDNGKSLPSAVEPSHRPDIAPSRPLFRPKLHTHSPELAVLWFRGNRRSVRRSYVTGNWKQCHSRQYKGKR